MLRGSLFGTKCNESSGCYATQIILSSQLHTLQKRSKLLCKANRIAGTPFQHGSDEIVAQSCKLYLHYYITNISLPQSISESVEL